MKKAKILNLKNKKIFKNTAKKIKEWNNEKQTKKDIDIIYCDDYV